MAETRRKFDHDFREGAVRLVRETGKPIAEVARDLGVNAGTLGNRVNADKRRRGDGTGALDEDEQAELTRLRRENAELAMERDVLIAQRGPLGQGRDGAVAVAALIAAQRDRHRIPHTVACRALGVSRSWFYKWKAGRLPPRAKRRQRLKTEVKRLFEAHGGKYGSPRTPSPVCCVSRAWPHGGRRSASPPPGQERAMAGPGPGQAGLPGSEDQPQVVRRRHGDPHWGGQALPRLGAGHGLPAGARVRAERAPRRQARLRRAGHGRGGARRPGARGHPAHRPGQQYTPNTPAFTSPRH
jgi:transposase